MMRPKINLDQLKEYLKDYKPKALSIFNDREKVAKVIVQALSKAQKNKFSLEKVWADIQLMTMLLKDYYSGRYRAVPQRSIIAILMGIIYFLAPLDFIPDFIAVLGFADDIYVIKMVLDQIKTDLLQYREWKENQPETDGLTPELINV